MYFIAKQGKKDTNFKLLSLILYIFDNLITVGNNLQMINQEGDHKGQANNEMKQSLGLHLI